MANLEIGSTSGGYTILTTKDIQSLVSMTGQSIATTTNTVSYFTKVATITLTSQYSQSLTILEFMSGTGSSAFFQYGKLYFRVKQQNPMGQAPVISLQIMSNLYFNAADAIAVLSVNSSSQTVVDLYVKVRFTYDNLYYKAIMVDNPAGLTLYNMQNNGGLIATVPTGISQTIATLAMSSGYYGTVTMAQGTTSVTANHGLQYVPTIVLLTPSNNIGSYWYNNVYSGTFQINCSTAAGTNVPISFYVR